MLTSRLSCSFRPTIVNALSNSSNRKQLHSNQMAMFTKNLSKKTIVLFIDFSFEDMEAMYPKVNLNS
jgi:hypothetical protein